MSGPNCFGKNCQYNCGDPELVDLGFNPDCKGQLFCLEDPYGCSCAPGFNGLDCKNGKKKRQGQNPLSLHGKTHIEDKVLESGRLTKETEHKVVVNNELN